VETLMLTPEQRSEFDQLGIVRLPAAIAAENIDQMRDLLWTSLESDHGVHRNDSTTWISERVTGIQRVARSDAYAAMASPAICSALNDLFGVGAWERPRHWGQPLVTFPGESTRWDVPHASWHLDAPATRASSKLAGVIVFTFLAPVLERGGGTVVLAGSHRVVEDFAAKADPSEEWRSADVRKALARAEPWLRNLWSCEQEIDRVPRFMTDGAVVRGVPMRVIELTGEPGDAIIWHSWLFHAPASNCRSQPRLMLRQVINRVRTDANS
jgi:ectoine hydroxylase-related dioxygenase (phytanoyl-CoA dioxygenase family)